VAARVKAGETLRVCTCVCRRIASRTKDSRAKNRRKLAERDSRLNDNDWLTMLKCNILSGI
jgi:hypothetical protein